MIACNDEKISATLIYVSGSVSLQDRIVSDLTEPDEVAIYEKEMKWLSECKNRFVDWYAQNSGSGDNEEKKVCTIINEGLLKSLQIPD